MIYGLLITLYLFIGFLLLLLIFIQKGKGSLGLGNIGGGNQMLFGGSGGQDFFQKATWVLGALFMAGSLLLALMKAGSFQTSKYLGGRRASQPVAEYQQESSSQEIPPVEQAESPSEQQPQN